MANFNITINRRKVIPNLFYIGKLLLLGSLVHFMIIPLLFSTVSFLGELRSPWQILFTVVITAYLSDVIQIKFQGRDWF